MRKGLLKTLLGTAVLTLSILAGVANTEKCYAWEADYAPAEAATAVQSYQDGSQYVTCTIAQDYFGENYHAVVFNNPTGGKIYVMGIGDEFCDVVSSGEPYPGLGGNRTEDTIQFLMNGVFYEAHVSVDAQSAWSGNGLPTISFGEPTDRGDGTASVWLHLEAPNGMKEMQIQAAESGMNGAWLGGVTPFYFKLNGQTTLDLEIVVADANPIGVELYDNLDNRVIESTKAHAEIIPYYWLSNYFSASYFHYSNFVPFQRLFHQDDVDGGNGVSLDYFWNTDGSAKIIDRTQIPNTDWSDANNYELNPAVKNQEKRYLDDGTINYLSPAQLQAGQSNTTQPTTVGLGVQTTTAKPVETKTQTETTVNAETETVPAIENETTVAPETATQQTEAEKTTIANIESTTVEADTALQRETATTQAETTAQQVQEQFLAMAGGNSDNVVIQTSNGVTRVTSTDGKAVTVELSFTSPIGIEFIHCPNDASMVSATFDYTFKEDGEYSFIVHDKAGNESIKQVIVGGIGSSTAQTLSPVAQSDIELLLSVPEEGIKTMEVLPQTGGNATAYGVITAVVILAILALGGVLIYLKRR